MHISSHSVIMCFALVALLDVSASRNIDSNSLAYRSALNISIYGSTYESGDG